MSEPSSSSLTAMRESLALALSTNPDDADAHEQLDGAVPHYDRTYSHHPPAVLTGEITATRRVIAPSSTTTVNTAAPTCSRSVAGCPDCSGTWRSTKATTVPPPRTWPPHCD